MVDFLTLSPIALNFGPFHVRWYGIFIASAVLIAVYLSMKEAQRQKLNEDYLYDLILWAIPISIISPILIFIIHSLSLLFFSIYNLLLIFPLAFLIIFQSLLMAYLDFLILN